MFTFKCFFKNVSLSFKSKAWQSLWLGFEDIIEGISKMGFGNETRIRHVRVGFQEYQPSLQCDCHLSTLPDAELALRSSALVLTQVPALKSLCCPGRPPKVAGIARLCHWVWFASTSNLAVPLLKLQLIIKTLKHLFSIGVIYLVFSAFHEETVKLRCHLLCVRSVIIFQFAF